MALFDDKLADEITGLIRQQHEGLGAALVPQDGAGSDPVANPGGLEGDLALLIAVANGAYPRTDALVGQVEGALARVLELLLGNALHTRAVIPDDFWPTDIGVLVSRVRWWISMDDLITITNAAALAFGEATQANRMRIARAIDRGLLDWVPDPSVANPQQNRRVLRSQVERLRDLSRLPE